MMTDPDLNFTSQINVSKELSGPNGIAFSPDGKYLCVGNWDEKIKIIMRHEVKADGTVSNSKVFYAMTKAPGEDAIDGIKEALRKQNVI
jgi:gluconolactonase